METESDAEFLDIEFELGAEVEEEGGSEHYEWEEEQSIYDTNDFISGPVLSQSSSIADNILEFHHSFGYDCKKLYNLVVAEENVLIFASGNLINFFDVQANEIWFRRSAFGEGIGHITKNPNPLYPHIAVAENGFSPPIIIYEWPSLEIVCLLKGGTLRRYSHINYSPDGELFCSQGGEPDYMLTIFNWRKHRIMLRMKSYVNDVFNVMFSPYVPGQLTSSGAGHLKFWKMCQTFTGLKLKGEPGRFGKTEISDILGIYPMPDEKVISGCEWGNFLVWDEGLIKKEVTRTNGKRCHGGAITQFEYINGELITVSKDGWVRMWYFETIDTANPPDNFRYVASEPSYEFHTGEDKSVKTELMCIVKKNNVPKDEFWYAQDGNGGLLLIDLTTDVEVTPSQRLFRCHAGAVIAMAASPSSTHICTFGVDGRLHFYNYFNKDLIMIKQFTAKGIDMIWFPISVDPTGAVIVLAFDDGVLRIIAVNINLIQSTKGMDPDCITLIQVAKPHNKPLTKISMNPNETLLVTGAEDDTCFIFQIDRHHDGFTKLVPVGYIFTPSAISSISWKPNTISTVLLGCLYGEFMEADLPHGPTLETDVSYLLKHVKIRKNRFVSVKSQIRRDLQIKEREEKREEKYQAKLRALKKLKSENPGATVDEELFLAPTEEEEEELEPIFIPKIPNRILFAQYTPANTIWLSMAGFDAGYIYEYDLCNPEPVQCTLICDGDDIEIPTYMNAPQNKFLIFGMGNGQIRLNRINLKDFRDLTDYWKLSMHDTFNGHISCMCFSYDLKFFFSGGYDGNIFSYEYNPEAEISEMSPPTLTVVKHVAKKAVNDILEASHYSLEESKTKAEYDRKMKVANERKEKVLSELRSMTTTFRKLSQRNKQLLPSQVIPHDEFLLDPRITQDLEGKLKAQINLVHRKLAFAVEKSRLAYEKVMEYYVNPIDMYPFRVLSINTQQKVKIFRARKLDALYYSSRATLQRKIEEAEAKARKRIVVPEQEEEKPKADTGPRGPPPALEKMAPPLEPFLMGLSPSTIEFRLTAKINRLLKKYRLRRQKLESRRKEWDALTARKPVEGVNHPDDEAALKTAEASIGDFKLKSAADFKAGERLETTLTKYKQLLDLREKIFNMRHQFNVRVLALRQTKVDLIQKINLASKQLLGIHMEIPENRLRELPTAPVIDKEAEFPELNFEIKVAIHEDKAPPLFRQRNFTKIIGVVEPVDYQLQVIGLERGQVKEAEDSLDTILSVRLEDDFHELSDITIETLRGMAEQETVDTPWEQELRQVRLARKLFEQDVLISDVERSIEEFDDDLDVLIRDRFLLHVDTTFKEHFLLQLHQELLILKEFEAIEDMLSERVQDKKDEINDVNDQIKDILSMIETRKREIEQCQEKEKELQQQFNAAVVDNKFLDFLRRIFKKKWRPPKIRTDDDESESSSEDDSSTEEENEDEGSIDSKNIGVLRMDESVCPKGCEETIYNLTFTLRGLRHIQEQTIINQMKNIETNKKEIDDLKKKMKALDISLKRTEHELEMYQREKQQKLNEVECLLLLRLNQLRNFTPEKTWTPLRLSLLFTKGTLESLDNRVGELQTETLNQRAKHKKNKMHLIRMKTDCKYMEGQISKINAQIIELMKLRFGSVVDIEDLQSAVLRRLVHELRVSMLTVKKEYEKKLCDGREKFRERQLELSKTIQENTERLNLLVVLEEEKNKLSAMLKFQREKITTFEPDAEAKYAGDLNRLTRITKTQQLQIQALRDEINILNMKSGSPLRPDSIHGHTSGLSETTTPYSTSPSGTPLSQEKEIRTVSAIEELYRAPTRGALDNAPEMIKTLIYELITFVRQEQPDTKVAEEVLHDAIEDIFEAHETEKSDNFVKTVASIVDTISMRLHNDDEDIRDGLTDIVGDIMWELRNVKTKPSSTSGGTATTSEVSQSEYNDTATELLHEIVSDTLGGKHKKPHTVKSLQQCIERVVANSLNQLPASFVTKKKSIRIIVDRLNNAIEVKPGDVAPRLPVDIMQENVIHLMKSPDKTPEDVRGILNEIIKSFLTGDLMPTLDDKTF